MLETQNSGATAKLSAMSTPPDSTQELPGSASPPGVPAACGLSSPPRTSTELSGARRENGHRMMTAGPSRVARRMRQYRKRRRTGVRRITLELEAADIDGLVRTKFLRQEQRGDPEMLQAVVLGLVYDAAAGLLARRR